MERGTILVVDDEPNIADLVELYLRRDGYRVVKAATGEDVAAAVTNHRPRLVVLDVGLPDIDGLEVCRRLRQTSAIPVIFLTARDTEIDRVLGPRARRRRLRHQAVLAARARRPGEGRAPARRRRDDHGRAAAGRRRDDRPRAPRGARRTTSPFAFTAKEFDLLKFLAERPGLALSRQQILDGVWGFDWFGDERTVDVHIAQVRKKLVGRGPHRHRARPRVPPRREVSA